MVELVGWRVGESYANCQQLAVVATPKCMKGVVTHHLYILGVAFKFP